jgi:protein-S-isoprenylcysteine O-methyltransferase Ste14
VTASRPLSHRAGLPLTLAILSTALDAALLALALGSFSALLATPRALGLLAVWAAGNVLLALAAPRRGEPRAPADRDAPLVLAALFVLPIAAAPLSAWGGRAGLAPLLPGSPAHLIGIAIAALGLWLRIAAMFRLGARFSPTVAMRADHTLETGGPYARLRHPGYLGAWIAALGGALTFDSALGLVPVALLIPAIALRVRREEQALEQRFGDEFRRWRAGTGAIWPRFGRS